ncbi:MAG: nucleotidyl transferase AbiEii/AbiGii toxin family protein [Candidatus Omnitrophota bacterium]
MKQFYNSLQIREVFHLEFLRWMGRKIDPKHYAVKGGVNLRLFFKSLRYSEDMDLDVGVISVEDLKNIIMKILENQTFCDNLREFGIDKVIAPNMEHAKQTQTTQRFKVHLLTSGAEDLFTKVEFSRRGFTREFTVAPVSDEVLRFYKLPPLLVSHYTVSSALVQKITSLAARTITQPRDIFDLYILNSFYADIDFEQMRHLDKTVLSKAYDNIFEIGFEEFKDKVASYLSVEDQSSYSNVSSWEQIRLKSAALIEQIKKDYA